MMLKIEIFEPAGCCATSSVAVNSAAVAFNVDVEWAKKHHLDVSRHNLAKNPQCFMDNPLVKHFLDSSGLESLPLTVVDGSIALAGRLPTRDDFMRWSGQRPQEKWNEKDFPKCC